MLSLAFEGLMPRDNPKNTRFSINFFTSIGLGGLTWVYTWCRSLCIYLFYNQCVYEYLVFLLHVYIKVGTFTINSLSLSRPSFRDDLREHLKNAQKLIMAQKQVVSSSDTDSDSDSSKLTLFVVATNIIAGNSMASISLHTRWLWKRDRELQRQQWRQQQRQWAEQQLLGRRATEVSSIPFWRANRMEIFIVVK